MSSKYNEWAQQRAAEQICKSLRNKPKLESAFNLDGTRAIVHPRSLRVIKRIMRYYGLKSRDVRSVLHIVYEAMRISQQAETSRKVPAARKQADRPLDERTRPGVCYRPRMPVF